MRTPRVIPFWGPGESDVLDDSKAKTHRNSKAPMDLFDPRGNTVTYEEYYQCRDRVCGSSPVPLAETPTSPKVPSMITTSTPEGA